MPVRIKRPEVKKSDIAFRKWALAAFLSAAVFGTVFAALINTILDAGKAVISDRFIDSSAVYQGMARGLGVENVYKINEFATQGVMPKVTIHRDLPAKVGISRKNDQKELDRMELESMEFHERVAEGYRKLALLAPERIYTIDATQTIEAIHKQIVDKIDNILS